MFVVVKDINGNVFEVRSNKELFYNSNKGDDIKCYNYNGLITGWHWFTSCEK